MLPLQKFREIVFQLMYSHDIAQSDPQDMIPLIMTELEVSKKSVVAAQERVNTIVPKFSEIDALIAKASLSYEFERIQTVERNILRLGIFEMIFDETIPPKVAIAEALRLARKFGSPESASFVNAVLDSVYKDQQDATKKQQD